MDVDDDVNAGVWDPECPARVGVWSPREEGRSVAVRQRRREVFLLRGAEPLVPVETVCPARLPAASGGGVSQLPRGCQLFLSYGGGLAGDDSGGWGGGGEGVLVGGGIPGAAKETSNSSSGRSRTFSMNNIPPN